jgi:hypothetical protein
MIVGLAKTAKEKVVKNKTPSDCGKQEIYLIAGENDSFNVSIHRNLQLIVGLAGVGNLYRFHVRSNHFIT